MSSGSDQATAVLNAYRDHMRIGQISAINLRAVEGHADLECELENGRHHQHWLMRCFIARRMSHQRSNPPSTATATVDLGADNGRPQDLIAAAVPLREK